MTSSHHAPYVQGYTRATLAHTKGCDTARSRWTSSIVGRTVGGHASLWRANLDQKGDRNWFRRCAWGPADALLTFERQAAGGAARGAPRRTLKTAQLAKSIPVSPSPSQ